MEKIEALFSWNLFGVEVGITSSILIQWVVILLISILCIAVTRNLKKIPDRRQSVLEILVGSINNLVRENMGESYLSFVPYIGTLAIYLLVLNFVPLVGAPAPTEDLSVTVGLAAITFFVIQGYTIKKIGLLHYFTAFAKPMPAMLPLNILERVTLPVSLSLRLFGNLTAGAVVMGLVYKALGYFAIAIPVPLHFYFDMFDGAVQMIIFVMLTMINIKITAEH